MFIRSNFADELCLLDLNLICIAPLFWLSGGRWDFPNFCLGLVFFMRRGAASRADTFGAVVSWPLLPSTQTSCLYFVVIYLSGIITGFVVAL